MTDSNVINWLTNDPSSKRNSFDHPLVIGTTEFENPVKSPVVISYLKKEEYKNNPIIELFSEKCLRLELDHSEMKGPHFSLNERKITFKSQSQKQMELQTEPNMEILVEPAASYFIGEDSIKKSDSKNIQENKNGTNSVLNNGTENSSNKEEIINNVTKNGCQKTNHHSDGDDDVIINKSNQCNDLDSINEDNAIKETNNDDNNKETSTQNNKENNNNNDNIINESSNDNNVDDINASSDLKKEKNKQGNHNNHDHHNNNSKSYLKNFPDFRLKEVQIFSVVLSSFETKFNFIEPVVCSAFLFCDRKIISEIWHFVPDQTIPFFERYHLRADVNQKAAFHYDSVSPKTYFIVVLNRTLQSKNGLICNKFYRKNTNSLLKEANQSVVKSWPMNNDLFSSFAMTFAPISELLFHSRDGLTIPEPFEINSTPDNDQIESYINNYDKNITNNKNRFGFRMTFQVQVKSVVDPNVLLAEGFSIMQSLLPPSIEPILRFRHQLIVMLNETKLKLPSDIKTSTLFAQFSYQIGISSERIPIVKNRYINECSLEVSTNCEYHQTKNPIFNTLFVIDLPPKIDPNTKLVIEYFSAPCKAYPKCFFIGSSSLSLFKDGVFVRDGVHKLDINYKSAKQQQLSQQQDNNNALNETVLGLRLCSSLIFNDKYLNSFFDKEKNSGSLNFQDFAKIPPIVLLHNLFQVVNVLIENFATSPDDVIISFEILVKNILPIYNQIEEFLIGYALQYALRNPNSLHKMFHHSLIISWSKIITMEKEKIGAERFDIYLADFFFLLIVKSIFLNKDFDIEDIFLNFAKSWSDSVVPLCDSGLIQAKQFSLSFAHFLNMLYDIGFCSCVIKAIEIQLNSFRDRANDHSVMMYFFENVFTPKLFVSSLFFIPKTEEIVMKMIQKSKDSPDSVPLHLIFNILLKVLAQIDEGLSEKIVKHLIGVLSILSPLSDIPFVSNNNDVHPALILYVVIITYLYKEEVFEKWWKNSILISKEKENDFFLSLHFLLDNVKRSALFETGSSVNKNNSNIFQSIENSYSRIRSQTNYNNNIQNPRSFLQKHKKSKLFSKSYEVDPKTSEKRKEEIIYSTQNSVLHIIEVLTEIEQQRNKSEEEKQIRFNPNNKNLTTFSQITKVIYHLLCSDLAIDFIRPLINLCSRISAHNIDLLFNQCCPVLPKFLSKVLKLSLVDTYCNDFFISLFNSDRKVHKNNNRSMAATIRAFSLDESSISDVMCSAINDTINELTRINKSLLVPNTDYETKADLLFEKFLLLKRSPDYQLEILEKLAELHKQNEYFSEEIQVLLLEAALVIEYIFLYKNMKNIPNSKKQSKNVNDEIKNKADIGNRDNKLILGIEDAALIFEGICTTANLAVCPFDVRNDLPTIPSFCDSYMFTEFYFFQQIDKIIKRCKEVELYEISGSLLDVLWPFLEEKRMYNYITDELREFSIIYKKLAQIPADQDRMFGHYFRVSFYGELFGMNNKSVYIYREKKLTHLFEISSRLLSLYREIFGEERIELIKESGAVDEKSLNPTKGYIQITFLEPFVQKGRTLFTQFEKYHLLKQFYFDTPFTKSLTSDNSKNKAQGSVDQQWLRKTILTVDFSMPFCLKRQKVDIEKSIKTVELPPIRVSYRQLKDRTEQLKAAIEIGDNRKIQQLLHGSLLVQVNEGPSKMAEVFLSKSDENENEERKNNKYLLKMKKAFQDFITTNGIGLKKHADFVSMNSEFIPLQTELESGFSSLKHGIEIYL